MDTINTMDSKYYAYYKPNNKVELMNDIKTQLLEEYDSLVVNKLLGQIFNNINNNDTDEYLCCDKNNFLILIKFTLVNKIFINENNIDKNNYTLIAKTVDWVGKKNKIQNINQHYYTADAYNSYNKIHNVLFNGSTNNQLINGETQYIFAEYLTIPIAPLIMIYKTLKFDTLYTHTNNLSQFTKSLLKYEKNGTLTDNNIKHILILLNTILATENVNYDRDYGPIPNEYSPENILSKKIIPYTNENANLVITIWNNIYKQPENIYEVFSNYKLIIDNTIKYLLTTNNPTTNNPTINNPTPTTNQNYLLCNVYSYLYITQKSFSSINYKDALPFRLSFDSKFKFDGSQVLHYHNKDVDEINRYTNEITKINIVIEKLLRTKPPTDNSIIRYQDSINYYNTLIADIKPRLLKINPYYKEHLLFHTNMGLKLSFEADLNAYKSLLYLRYVCNNYDRLNYENATNTTCPDFIFTYDNITDKKMML